MFLTFSLEDEHVSKIVIEGCWIHSIAFCSRSARFWDFHRKMKQFLGLALEDGGEATLQQGYHWIDQHVSEIVCRRCFWDCLCGIWTCFWGLGSTQHVSEIFIGRWGVERQVLETPSELRANMNRWIPSHPRRVELSPMKKLSVKKEIRMGLGWEYSRSSEYGMNNVTNLPFFLGQSSSIPVITHGPLPDTSRLLCRLIYKRQWYKYFILFSYKKYMNIMDIMTLLIHIFWFS